jgi:hypothetical protein
MSHRNIRLLLCVWMVFAWMVGHAQVNTGNVYGTITDTAGAVVPGTDVELKNEATNLTRMAKTNANGEFSFEFVPVGTYSATVHRDGFQPEKRESIVLVAAQSLHLDFQIRVHAVQETVNVTGDLQPLSLDSSAQDNTITQAQVNQLPVQKQDWTSLLHLGAGQSTQGTDTSGTGISVTLNGLPPAGYNLTVDGTNATSDPELPALSFYQAPNIINTLNSDAIEEISVVKGIAPASVGGTMSGNINLITKGGTNAFHGDVYEINDVSAYDARNQFLTSKPRSTFNEFGGSIGGPILRNRLFFFLSAEGARLSSEAAITGQVPTPYLISISPSVYEDQFAAFPHVAQPAGDPTALTAQYFGVGSKRQNDQNEVGRIDYQLNQNDILSVRYTRARPYKLNPNIVIPNSRRTDAATDSINANYTHAGRAWTSNARFGYNRIRLSRLDEGYTTDLEEIKFLFDSNGAELFTKTGNFYTGEEAIAISRGPHTIQLGAIVQKQNAGRTDFNTATLQYSTLDDFLNNTPTQSVMTFGLPLYSFYTYQFGGYIQDDYRVTQNLTLNLGIRYDYFTVPQEMNGHMFNRGVDPERPELGPGFGPYLPADSMYNADATNFQPRVGFSWGGDKNTVVRGGFGIFVSPHPIYGGPIEMIQPSIHSPTRLTLNLQQTQEAGIQYPLPQSSFNQVLADLQTAGIIGSSFANSTISQYFPNPYSMQWMLGIQRSLPAAMTLEVNYVGNRGVKENLTESENLPDRLTGDAPVPSFGQFHRYLAGDSSNYHGLQVSLSRRLQNGLTFGSSYTWSKVLSYSDGDLLLQANPQNNNDLNADYGPAPYDITHVFTLNALWELPLDKWAGTHGRAGRLALGGWQITGVFAANTGLPANITNGSSAYSVDRPDRTAGQHFYLSNYHSTHNYLNPLAFTAVPLSSASGEQIRPGNLGRNTIRSPGALNTDLSLSKTITFGERIRLQLHADAFNAFNHTNLSGLVTNVSSGSLGELTTATARTMQIGAKVRF